MAASFAIFLVVCLGLVSAQDPIADTKYGQVRGLYSTVDEVNVTYFRGIRYGEAPVGDLRFALPLEVAPWAPAVYDATVFGPSCPQNLTGYPSWMANALPNEDISEDCLLLNVYVPGHTFPPTKTYPVMVWIHGGSFVYGQGMLYESSVLSGFFDVIVVTINYRLGTFGFLSTGDAYAPGNFGLHDQILSLQWVQENIAGFGGDPTQVTIFGESAGGISTGILAHSPKASGFKNVISQSGCLHPGFVIPVEKATDFAYQMGYELGCNTTTNPDLTNHAELLDCFRAQTWEDLIEAQGGTVTYPVEDGDIIPSMEGIKADEKFQNYNYMAGTLSWEAGVITTAMPSLNDGDMTQAVFNGLVVAQVQLMYEQNEEPIIDASLYQYKDWFRPDDGAVRLDNYRWFMNDITFLAPAVQTLRAHSSRGVLPPQPTTTSYHYYFDYRPSFYTGPDYIDGAEHAIEIMFMFGNVLVSGFGPLENITTPSYEKELSYKMATYWTNFAKSGDPNLPEAVPEAWPVFDNDLQKFVFFTVNMTAPYYTQENIRANDVAFWLDYVEPIHNYNSCDVLQPAQQGAPITLLNLDADEAESALYGLFLASVCLAVIAVALVAAVVIMRRNRRRRDDQVPLNPY